MWRWKLNNQMRSWLLAFAFNIFILIRCSTTKNSKQNKNKMKKFTRLYCNTKKKRWKIHQWTFEIEVAEKLTNSAVTLLYPELIILNKVFSRFVRTNYQLSTKRNEFLCTFKWQRDRERKNVWRNTHTRTQNSHKAIVRHRPRAHNSPPTINVLFCCFCFLWPLLLFS